MRRRLSLKGALVARDQPAGLDAAQPAAGVLGEALGGLLALALQRQIDVVVVDEHRAEARPASFPLHCRRPPNCRTLLLRHMQNCSARNVACRMQSLSRAVRASSSYKGLPAIGENVQSATAGRAAGCGRPKRRMARQICNALRPRRVRRSRRLEARRRQLEARELEARRHRAADQRPGAEARGLLPGAGRHHRLRALAGGEVGAQPERRAGPSRRRSSAPAARPHTSARPRPHRPGASATPRRRAAGNRWRWRRPGRRRRWPRSRNVSR